MPGAGNPLAWNRYAYTLSNPLRYIDPSGNIPILDGEVYLLILSDGDDDDNDEIQTPTTPTPNPPPSPTLPPTPKPVPPPPNHITIHDHLSFSMFIELEFDLGGTDFLIGLEFGWTNLGDIFIMQYIGEPVACTDIGASASVGITTTFENDISELAGVDYDYYFTLAEGWLGGTIAVSENSMSLAYSPGYRVGFGGSVVYKTLIFLR